MKLFVADIILNDMAQANYKCSKSKFDIFTRTSRCDMMCLSDKFINIAQSILVLNDCIIILAH